MYLQVSFVIMLSGIVLSGFVCTRRYHVICFRLNKSPLCIGPFSSYLAHESRIMRFMTVSIKTLHPQSNIRQTENTWFLISRTTIWNLVQLELVTRNLGFMIWWIFVQQASGKYEKLLPENSSARMHTFTCTHAYMRAYYKLLTSAPIYACTTGSWPPCTINYWLLRI